MRYINFIIVAATTLVITSCGSSDTETQATPPVSTETSTQPATTTTTPTTTTPGTVTAPTVATTPGTIATPAATGSSALNPEHGKPGHRCDIAVGAPLNGKPIQATIQQPTSPTVTTTPTTVTAPTVTQKGTLNVNSNSTKTAAGINPAHGQPGHRCDIAVGAALDSKPIQSTIQQPTSSNTPSVPSPALPYTPVNNSSSTAVAKGMNPAHGQPGHRCDISVGAPLDSKPTQPATTVTQPTTINGTKKDVKAAVEVTDAAIKPKN